MSGVLLPHCWKKYCNFLKPILVCSQLHARKCICINFLLALSSSSTQRSLYYLWMKMWPIILVDEKLGACAHVTTWSWLPSVAHSWCGTTMCSRNGLTLSFPRHTVATYHNCFTEYITMTTLPSLCMADRQPGRIEIIMDELFHKSVVVVESPTIYEEKN